MNPPHSIINPIVNRNFGNKFHHQNGPNKRQHTNKNASHKYHNITTRQQYQHINTGQHHQNINTSQQYQTRSLQRYRTSSIPERKLSWVWNQQQRCDRTDNATLWNTRKLSLQSTIVHTRKVTQRTTPSEQSQTWIKSKGLQ